MKEFLNRNGTFITIGVALVVLIGGISLVNNNEYWWTLPALLSVVVALTLLVKGAAVIIKSILAIIFTIYIASVAFKVGSVFDASGQGGVGWAMSILALFFLSLTISYTKESLRSRWTASGMAVIVNFVLGFSIVVLSANLNLSAIIAFVLGLAAFVFFYYLFPGSRYNQSEMPTPILDDELFDKFSNNFEKNGWNIMRISQKSFIVWGDRVFLVSPHVLESPFGSFGRKSDKIGYQGKPITAWLNSITSEVPSWMDGIRILPIILDIENRNGKNSRILSFKGADHIREGSYVVVPGKDFADGRNLAKFLEKEFNYKFEPESQKNIDRLNKKLKRENEKNDKILDKTNS